jgi:NADH-quinone oxidoreductase subunit J
MSANLILFIILAGVAVGSAVAMLLSRNAIYAALFLILNFVAVALFYVVLDAPFIAISQVTVYAGAIMVLFLFVIMLLGAEQTGLPCRGGTSGLLVPGAVLLMRPPSSSFLKPVSFLPRWMSPPLLALPWLSARNCSRAICCRSKPPRFCY